MKGEYKYKQLLVRMNYNTFVRLRGVFPSYRGESAAGYFNRLAGYLEKLNKGFSNECKEVK